MDENVNQQINKEYEIWVNGALILRGKDLDELLKDAKLMYVNETFVIKDPQRNEQE